MGSRNLVRDFRRGPCVALFCILAVLSGCGKKEKIDATVPLQQSFEKSDPEVKKTVDAVNENLKNKKYAEALKTLTPVVSQTNLSAQQRDAIGAVLQQVTTAAAEDPALNTKEMYQLRLQLVQKLHEHR